MPGAAPGFVHPAESGDQTPGLPALRSLPERHRSGETGPTCRAGPGRQSVLSARLAARQLNVRDLQEGLEGKFGIVVGWGYTEYNPYQAGSQGDLDIFRVAENYQQKLEVPVVSAGQCRDTFRGTFSPAGQTGQGRAAPVSHVNCYLR